MFAQYFTTPLAVAKSAVIIPVDSFPMLSSLKTPPEYMHLVNRTVIVETLYYGTQQAIVYGVVPSPFFNETGMTAYVEGKGFNDYLPLDTVLEMLGMSEPKSEGGEVVAPSLHCPECGYPLVDCDCAPSWLDDPEFPDYQLTEYVWASHMTPEFLTD